MCMKFVLMKMSYVAGVSIFLCSLAANTVLAQTTYSYTQTAGGAQSWTTASNWSPAAVPNPVAGDTINFLYPANQAAATTLDLGAARTAELWKYSKNGGFSSGTFTIAAGYTINLAGTSPTIESGSGSTFIFNNVLAGTSGLTKTGSGTLSLNNAANSFSGGIELAGGALTVASDARLGDAGNGIDVSASTTLSLSSGSYARNIVISNGATLGFSEKITVTLSGAITGAGGIRVSAGGFGDQNYTLSNTGNAFTGMLKLGQGDTGVALTANSFADSANPIELQLCSKGDTKFVWGSGAIAPLVLDNRQIILSGNQTKNHVIENANADPNNTITINTDFSITRTVDKSLVLQGVNTGDNTIAGVISNGASGSITSLQKSGAGTWVLSGANTYSGNTTVAGGNLALAESSCLLDSGTLTINGGKLRLDAGVKERIDNLVLGGATQTTNTSYGSLSSSAAIRNDSYFTGPGLLYLAVDPPPAGTVFLIQ